ncbi:MAG: hypothetical protein DRJ01_07715 [Bacteroidetes bacterium]|nr:MAG: hypothetical protein DRJ01_07715 [Bacteroidota bacterium]
MTCIIEHYGLICKEEKISKLTDSIVRNSCVYEAIKPYPGYYDYFQKEAKPLYIYLITKTKYTTEKIIRSSQKIQENFECKFSVAWGTIKIYYKNINVIRILGLEDYGLIKPLQEEYIKHGIEFKKTSKKKVKAQSIIKIHKLFQLKEIDKNMYFDVNEPSHAYFILPKQISWDKFLVITKKVKYNWDLSMFDAAIGYFYTNYKVQDIIRIYNKGINQEYLQLIKEKYLGEINR